MGGCRQCGGGAADGQGLCRTCRLRAFGQFRRKYFWTPELIDELRRAYCGRKGQISAALDQLERRTGWPRHAFKSEAIRLGLITADHRRAWTDEETAYLREKLGLVSARQIAKTLGRSVLSVESRAEKLKISRRHREGYNASDLQQAFGESPHKIRRWMDRGLLGRVHVNGELRVTETAVMRFMRAHASEYDLRRVDQDWYKAMLFGHLAEYGESDEKRRD